MFVNNNNGGGEKSKIDMSIIARIKAMRSKSRETVETLEVSREENIRRI